MNKRLSTAQYIIAVLGFGLLLFMGFFVGLGFIAAGLTWIITRGSDNEDRVMASILAGIAGVVLQVWLMLVVL